MANQTLLTVSVVNNTNFIITQTTNFRFFLSKINYIINMPKLNREQGLEKNYQSPLVEKKINK